MRILNRNTNKNYITGTVLNFDIILGECQVPRLQLLALLQKGIFSFQNLMLL